MSNNITNIQCVLVEPYRSNTVIFVTIAIEGGLSQAVEIVLNSQTHFLGFITNNINGIGQLLPDSTGQDSTGQDNTGPDSTGNN